MVPAASVKVNNRYQIALPSEARRKLKIESGDRLLVDVQDGVLVLMNRLSSHLAVLVLDDFI